MTVFLYETRRLVELTLRETAGLPNWNLPMNSNDFRLFKDVQNVVDFVVRNTDRKPINMTGRTAQINLYDQRTNTLLWTSPLKVLSDQKGTMRMTMPPETMDDWNLGPYSYCVMVTNADTTTHMLYVNQNEGDRGFFEVHDGPRLDPYNSYTLNWADLTEVNEGYDPTVSFFVATFPGSMQRDRSSGLHTVALYLDNFSGKIKVQGSLESSSPNPTTDAEWFDIEVLPEFDKKTGVIPYTFEANVMWVRLKIYRKDDLLDVTLPEDAGFVTKLVFRN